MFVSGKWVRRNRSSPTWPWWRRYCYRVQLTISSNPQTRTKSRPFRECFCTCAPDCNGTGCLFHDPCQHLLKKYFEASNVEVLSVESAIAGDVI